jgi:hypothetical protein
MPSVFLGFVISRRRQGIGNSLQPGGVMRLSILHGVDNDLTLNLDPNRVNVEMRDSAAALRARRLLDNGEGRGVK